MYFYLLNLLKTSKTKTKSVLGCYLRVLTLHIKTYISSSATRRPTGRANITHVVDQECHKDGWLLDHLTIKVANYCRNKI